MRTKPTEDELRDRFHYHPPENEYDVRDHDILRRKLRDTAVYLVKITPLGREQALMITKLEEAMFWGNAALARARGKKPPPPETG